MRLSVIVPAFNERTTLGRMLVTAASALVDVEKEFVIVDDCSTDGTTEWLKMTFPTESWSGRISGLDEKGVLQLEPPEDDRPLSIVRVLYHSHNRGKGAGIQTALAVAGGDIVVVQDADLEYDPNDWTVMYDLIAIRKVADVVYGSRFFGRPHRSLYFHHFLANRLISFVFNALYNQTLSDVEVCYKMFTREVCESLALTCPDFGIEVQISAQIALARRWRIYETGISYYGRTYNEGKKINWRDGIKALWYLVKFRFVR